MTQKKDEEYTGAKCEKCGKKLWTCLLDNGVEKIERCTDCYPKEGELSLRDRFAIAAVAGLLAHEHYDSDCVESLGKCGYEIADEMLKSRRVE